MSTFCKSPLVRSYRQPLRQAIQRLIQDPLAMKLLNGDVLPGENVSIDADLKKGETKFYRESAKVER